MMMLIIAIVIITIVTILIILKVKKKIQTNTKLINKFKKEKRKTGFHNSKCDDVEQA